MTRALFFSVLLLASPAWSSPFWTENFDGYPIGGATYPWTSTGSAFVAQIENTSAHSSPNAVGTNGGWAGSGLYRTFNTSYTTITKGYVDLWFSYCGWGNCSQVYGPDGGSKVWVGYVANPYTSSPGVSGLVGVQTIQGSSSSVGTMQIVDQNGTPRGSPVTFSVVDWGAHLYNWHHFIMNYTLSSGSSGHIDFSVDGVGSSYDGPTNTGTTQPVNTIVLQFQTYGCCSTPPYTVAYDDITVGGLNPNLSNPVGRIIGLQDHSLYTPAALQNAYHQIEPITFIPHIKEIN